MAPEKSARCSDQDVRSLLSFVAARTAQDEARARGVDEPLLDLCELAHQLLDIAHRRCVDDDPCSLSPRHLRALATVAALHEDHPGFRGSWRHWLTPA